MVGFDLIKKDEPHPNLISTAKLISRSGRLGGDPSKNSIRYPEENVNSNFSPSTPDKLQKLESENAHLKEVNSILKMFFRQTAMVHMDALHISEIAEDVKKRYETHMPAREIGNVN